MLAYYSADLPWTITAEEQERYRRILKRVFLVILFFGLVLPFLPLPTIEREAIEELPPRLAKLILERQETAPPAPPVKAPEPEAVQAKPEPKKAVPKPAVKKVESARQKAERSGLLAFKDDLADLRDDSMTASLKKTATLTTGGGSSARTPARSLVTSNVSGGSGGINTARLSRDTGGGGLAGRSTTRVSSPVSGGGGGSVRRGASGQASRSIEEIKLIFDMNKAAIYALYNRALRQDPTLQGKVILKLTIAPSGQVTACEVISSELRVPDLERKLAARVRLFDFGAKDVDVMVVTYPIDFLPS
ncbi:MAG: AgmX/PglI C-terminal domain-containing protein [Gammaproteobacteria bacterium]|nr:AgmX/PglI C-terminal domain-containing protein [Gammaproteobacteria bacterium]MDH5512614.1 AgmX/PglI C-terminal domain-containing protein [Gammaproteobacteria bacterium]